MKKILRSKIFSWIALILIVALIIATYTLRTSWWAFFDVFFFFMMAFCHLLALNLYKMSPLASRKLDVAAFFFAIMGVIAFIVEWLLFSNVI